MRCGSRGAKRSGPSRIRSSASCVCWAVQSKPLPIQRFPAHCGIRSAKSRRGDEFERVPAQEVPTAGQPQGPRQPGQGEPQRQGRDPAEGATVQRPEIRARPGDRGDGEPHGQGPGLVVGAPGVRVGVGHQGAVATTAPPSSVIRHPGRVIRARRRDFGLIPAAVAAAAKSSAESETVPSLAPPATPLCVFGAHAGEQRVGDGAGALRSGRRRTWRREFRGGPGRDRPGRGQCGCGLARTALRGHCAHGGTGLAGTSG